MKKIILLFIAIALTGCSCAFLQYIGGGPTEWKTPLLPFEPFTQTSNMLVFVKAGGNQIYVLDTEKDEFTRRITLSNAFSIPITIGNGKIYTMTCPSPSYISKTLWVIYPEQGQGKEIRLEFDSPSYLIYNEAKKRVGVVYQSVYPDASNAEARGGNCPFGIVNAENDSYEKTCWGWEMMLFRGAGNNGKWYGSDNGFTPTNGYNLNSFDSDNNQWKVLYTNTRISSSGWCANDQVGLVNVRNKMYILSADDKKVLVYNTDTETLDYTIGLGTIPATNADYAFPSCVGYYATSNWLLVGVYEGQIAIVDLATTNILKWITNYSSTFHISNHKLYIYMGNPYNYNASNVFKVLSIDSNFQLLKEIVLTN